jgi:hypothetical protein
MGIRVLGYLDDFLVLASDVPELMRAMRVVVTDLIAAGITVSSDKAYVCPYERLEFLGVIIDLQTQCMRVSDSKRDQLVSGAAALCAGVGVRACSVSPLQHWLGRAMFACVVCPYLRYFVAAVWDVLVCLDNRLTLPGSVARLADAELRAWSSGEVAELLRRDWPWADRPDDVTLSSAELQADATLGVDASDGGLGIVGPAGDLSELLPRFMVPRSSFARELYGILRAVETGRFAPGSTVLIYCDNRGAVSAASARSSARSAPDIARELVRAILRADIRLRVAWLPRDDLWRPDALSRPHHAAGHAAPLPADCRRAATLVWGADASPTLEAFASDADRISAAPYGSLQWTHDASAAGEGLHLCASAAEETRIWANPPAVLAKRCTRLLLQRSATSIPALLCAFDADLSTFCCGLPHAVRLLVPVVALRTVAGLLTTPARSMSIYSITGTRSRTASAASAPLTGPPPATLPRDRAADAALVLAGALAIRSSAAAAKRARAAAAPAGSALPRLDECAGDLFVAVANDSVDWCLCHCVSACLSMSRGIAVPFLAQFGGKELMRAQQPRIGSCLTLVNTTRRHAYVFALVTKQVAADKPTYPALRAALCALRDTMLSLRVHRLAFPLLACGLDALDWPSVRALVLQVFAERASSPAWHLRCFRH